MSENIVKSTGKKWIGGLLLFIACSLVLCIYIIFSVINISKYSEYSSDIDKILIKGQKCSIASKEFLLNAYSDESFVLRGTNTTYEAVNSAIDSLHILVNSFGNSGFIDNPLKTQQANSLKSAMTSYKATFADMAALLKEKGFKDLGIEGTMRTAVHFIEKHEAPIDLKYLLTLRRHEKDFLLRKDVGYIQKFDKDLLEFKTYLEQHKQIKDANQRKELLDALITYQTTFYKITDIEKQIGLKANQGLRARLNEQMLQIETLLNEFNARILFEKKKAFKAVQIIIFSIVVLFVLVIVGVLYSIRYFNKSVLAPIQYLNHGAEQIAHGNFSVSLDSIKNKKLLGELVLSYDKLVNKMRLTISQIEQISTRKIKSHLALHNANDEIAISLNRVIEELAKLDQDETQRTWSAEGLTQFNQIMRSSTSMKELCDASVQFLVKYLQSNQAGLFLSEVTSTNTALKLIASYAYNRKKYLNKEVAAGEGLLGQCYFEKDVICLTEIPEDYLKITSGLGDANPRALLIVPMLYNEQVEAIFEIASFTEFEPYKIEFVRKAGDILAATIASMRVTATTKQLLDDTNAKSEKMQAQEEEMRQNLEELVATQEEMVRKERAYKEQIDQIQAENDQLKLQLEAHLKKAKQEETSNNVHANGNDNGNGNGKSSMHDTLKQIRHAGKYPRRIEHFLDN